MLLTYEEEERIFRDPGRKKANHFTKGGLRPHRNSEC